MTEEQIEARKKFAGEKKASMKRRDDHHDYTERRMYMITLEVEGRRPLFGRPVGNPFAKPGATDAPRIELTELGKAVQSEWLGIHRYYPQIEVRAVQMMPDHMHGILFVTAPLPVHLGQVITGFKAGCRKAQRAIAAAAAAGAAGAGAAAGAEAAAGTEAAAEPQPTEKPTEKPKEKPKVKLEEKQEEKPEEKLEEKPKEKPKVKPEEKGGRGAAAGPQAFQQVTALPSQGGSPYRPLFTQGYNDLILRSYDELSVWENYLHENPRRLLLKRARPEWLKPFFGFRVKTHCYSGIGNRKLLDVPKRKAVRVSRRLTDSEIDAEVDRYLALAKEGTVLVSPAISPGEKRVMRAAFNKGFPTIVVVENGFTALSKPHGEQFYACAEGRLLMLSPWEHHNEKRKLTAEQCRQMNLMALELCEPYEDHGRDN